MKNTITMKEDVQKEIEYWKDAKKSAIKSKNRYHANYCQGVIDGLSYPAL